MRSVDHDRHDRKVIRVISDVDVIDIQLNSMKDALVTISLTGTIHT